ncbi:AMP-binding protein [Litoribrevibacter albus]|uniref:Acyl-CoA synthetase n=1 Tax=Litoribrevibacter albus TaxID=1473156 RepID=A0AA37W955_9GAMM|nr:AMP-binding protein [Litoribrevibacter albus]GLQ32864.1 acyl-CoA synthetase [Litoribrevibacter albus]
MFFVNDDYFDQGYLAQQQSTFEQLTLSSESRIAVCLEDTALWLALCFYLKSIQASVMPIHPAMPKEAALRMAQKAGCSRLFYHGLETEHTCTIDTESNTINNFTNSINEVNNIKRDSGVLIQMSSGTTGEPKCIDRSWQSIDREIESYLSVFTLPNQMTPLIACPVSHSYGLICGVLVALARKKMARGQTPRVITNINPKYLVKTIQGADKPLLYTSPTMLQGVLRLLPKEQKLHAAMSSGTILPKHTFDQFSPRIEHFFQQYGCSEAGCITINQNMTSAIDVGTPLPHLSVTAGNSADAPDEVVVTTDAGQVIHTNDLGYLNVDAQGQAMLSFVSRLDDTIIVAGLNVYPQEVEDLILSHPHITDAVVFKVEDKYAGQRVGLQFTAQQHIEPSELRAWCQANLASFQIPQYFDQVEQIERLANGKVNRKQIAQTFQETQTKNARARAQSANTQPA